MNDYEWKQPTTKHLDPWDAPFDVAREALELHVQKCVAVIRECDDDTSEAAWQMALARYHQAEKALTDYNNWRASR